MPRKIEDIIPGDERKSIRNIPIPIRKTSSAPRIVEAAPEPEPVEAPQIPRLKMPPHRDFVQGKRSLSRKTFWVGGFLAVFIILFGVFSLFSGATLNYIPKSVPLSFNKDVYAAYKSADGELLFSLVKLSGEKSAPAKASGDEQVSIKASGQAIVYNNASPSVQRLIKNTRFETPDGKIYRVNTDISIPGKKGTTPGSLEVTLYADQPGESYNIAPTDFTVPGLKNDPRFETIYARSKTAMSGGFVGTRKKVSDEDMATAKTEIEGALKDELMNEAKAEVPADFILIPGLSTTTFEAATPVSSGGDAVSVSEKADFVGIMFKRSDLSNFLVSKKSPGSTGSFDVPELGALDMELVTGASNILNASSITFSVSGKAAGLSLVDEGSLKSALIGTKKSDLPAILKNFPTIESANAIIRPFWKTSFPTDSSNIKIIRTAK